jgi:ABC-2 type transport system ATP-binding protein
MDQPVAIAAEGLVKKFGEIEAVKGIDLSVRTGEIFGFLGPNGAGKSTTINILCTLMKATAGNAAVAGVDVERDPAGVRSRIGLVFQDPSLDQQLTARENLEFHAFMYNVPAAVRGQRIVEVLEMVDLADRANSIVMTFSGGMRRRLEIARGILHTPTVLFLDEPTIGLDPQTRRHIWQYLLKLRAQEGVTMFMTTHYMEEAEHCDRIAVIDHGKLVAIDTPAALKARVGGDIITVRTADNTQAAARLETVAGVETRPGPEGQLIVETKSGDRFIPQMMELLARGTPAIAVETISVSRPTLEDVFIKLTGHAIRGGEAESQMRTMMKMWRGAGARR